MGGSLATQALTEAPFPGLQIQAPGLVKRGVESAACSKSASHLGSGYHITQPGLGRTLNKGRGKCWDDPCAMSLSFPGLRPNTEPSGSSWGPSADPWSPVPSGNALSRSQPWDLLSTLSSSEPWGRTPVLPSGPPIADPWAPSSPARKLSSTGADPWGASVETSDTSGKWRA